MQHSMLKILLWNPPQTVVGFWHAPPQYTSLEAQPHVHVVSLNVPTEQVVFTHLLPVPSSHGAVPLGHAHAQVVGF